MITSDGRVIRLVDGRKTQIMDIATELCAVFLYINFFFSGTYTQIVENDIHVIHSNNTEVNKKLKDAFSHFINDSTAKLFEQSSDEDEFDGKELSKLKDLDKALEEFIATNSRLMETFDVSIPNSKKILEFNDSNNFNYNISTDDIINNEVSRNEFAPSIGGLFDTLSPNVVNQESRGNFKEDISFADLLKAKPYNFESANFIKNKNNINDKQQITRTKRENDVKNETESSYSTNPRVKFVNSTSELETKTSIDNKAAEEVLKLMKEDDSDNVDDDIIGSLEDIVEEVEKPTKSSSNKTFNKIPAQYIFPLLRATNMASNVLSTGYQTIKNTSNSLVHSLRKLG